MTQELIDKLENEKLLTELRLQKEKEQREQKEKEALEAAEIIPAAAEGEQAPEAPTE